MPTLPPKPDPGPTALSRASIAHYERHAADYTAALAGHDTAECREALLSVLPGEPPYRILDIGCGPGRDLAAFRAAGHRAVGLEPAPTLAATARLSSGCRVVAEDLLGTTLPDASFDGVFAQATLFHMPTALMPDALATIRRLLVPGGAFFACDPTGDGQEGWADDRLVAFRRPQTWKKLAREAGFTLLRDWRRPPGTPRRQQTWLATLWRA